MGKNILYPNIMAELARNGLSVAMLAEYMGRTTQNIYYKLNGRTEMTHKDMIKIQQFIHEYGGGVLTLDYLFQAKP